MTETRGVYGMMWYGMLCGVTGRDWREAAAAAHRGDEGPFPPARVVRQGGIPRGWQGRAVRHAAGFASMLKRSWAHDRTSRKKAVALESLYLLKRLKNFRRVRLAPYFACATDVSARRGAGPS